MQWYGCFCNNFLSDLFERCYATAKGRKIFGNNELFVVF